MKQTALGATRSNLLLAPIGAFVGLITTILIARFLSISLYTEYAISMAVVTWLLLIAEGGANLGLARHLEVAKNFDARYTLYRQLQLRRWIGVGFLCALAVTLTTQSEKSFSSSWKVPNLMILCLLTGFMLHSQLANSSLMALFKHQKVLLLTQSITILRALTLIVTASIYQDPQKLLLALLLVSILESFLLHRLVKKSFGNETKHIQRNLINQSQLHGIIGLFDKITTQLAGGPFLLLTLATVHQSDQLAVFAITTDLLQKLLSVSGLPITNLVSPLLNSSQNHHINFNSNIKRLSGIVVTWFSLVIGLLVSFIPFGLPLILGNKYAETTSIALVWLIPLFIESAVRMIWGSALLIKKYYRTLNYYNVAFGIIALVIIYFFRGVPLIDLLALIGVFKIFMSFMVIRLAINKNISPPEFQLIKIILACVTCSSFAVLIQHLFFQFNSIFVVAIGLITFICSLFICAKYIPLLSESTYSTILKILGPHSKKFTFIIKSPH